MYFDIIKLACDVESRRVLTLTDGSPRSVREIADLSGLPLARCYRLLKDLEDKKVIRRTKYKGTRGALYTSNIGSIHLSLVDDRLTFEIDYRDGTNESKQLTASDMEIRRIPQRDRIAQTVPEIGSATPSIA